jgi:hypothetical protein
MRQVQSRGLRTGYRALRRGEMQQLNHVYHKAKEVRTFSPFHLSNLSPITVQALLRGTKEKLSI